MLIAYSHSNTSQLNEGFTLVELAVVVLLVSVLLLGAFGLFDRSIQQENRRQCQQNIDLIDQAIVRSIAIDGRAPSGVNNTAVSRYITGGIGSLVCKVKTNPQPTYNVVGGKITPAHTH